MSVPIVEPSWQYSFPIPPPPPPSTRLLTQYDLMQLRKEEQRAKTRVRMAKYRAGLKALPVEVQQEAQERARAARARYRERHRVELRENAKCRRAGQSRFPTECHDGADSEGFKTPSSECQLGSAAESASPTEYHDGGAEVFKTPSSECQLVSARASSSRFATECHDIGAPPSDKFQLVSACIEDLTSKIEQQKMELEKLEEQRSAVQMEFSAPSLP
ncbi:hypothetical protein C8R44DRAFT_764167 [Mycena epipterygia]|nr:hypothetical protein C8R44DRAFT_764167 [Mycena epipterygia]